MRTAHVGLGLMAVALAAAGGYLAGQWQWAISDTKLVSDKRWGAGYYIAYIMEDDDGNAEILHSVGPTQ